MPTKQLHYSYSHTQFNKNGYNRDGNKRKKKKKFNSLYTKINSTTEQVSEITKTQALTQYR